MITVYIKVKFRVNLFAFKVDIRTVERTYTIPTGLPVPPFSWEQDERGVYLKVSA